MDFGLTDRTAVVTGGAGRPGSDDCRVFAQEGVEVVVLDVDEDCAQRVADELYDHEEQRAENGSRAADADANSDAGTKRTGPGRHFPRGR